MRLRLRDDVYIAATDDGVRILTHRGLARIDGTAIAEWLDRLTPFLGGEHTLEELTASLPPGPARSVKRVIELLVECDAVQLVPQQQDIPDDRVTVIAGVEPMLTPLVRAARASELRNITVMRLDLLPRKHTIDLPDETGVVLYAGDGPTALPLERACAHLGIPLALMVRTDDATWLLPPGTAMWDDARRRMGTTGAHVGTPPTGATARLVQATIRALTGAMPPAERGRMVRMEHGSWTSTWHSCLPHPFAATASVRSREEFLQRVRDLRAGEPLDGESFLHRIAPCHDEYVGLFTLTEAPGPQSPLNLCRAVLPDGRFTIGTGFDYNAARCDAARKALAAYGARMVDPRRLAGADGRPLTDPRVDPSEHGRVWGYEIDDRETARLVPVADVFTAEGAGLATGHDWEHAVGRGLADQCLRITLAEIPSRSEPYPRVDLTTVALRDTRSREILARLDELPEVYDLTGPLGVTVLACCSGADTIGYFAALDPAEALEEGLRAALLRLQSGYGPADPLPDRLRGSWRQFSASAVDVTTVASRLRARGRVATAVPLDHDPAVAEIMPYLARVVV
ncbi:YcaO-like family protein [Nonomuraea sp. SYSU D8015]|uniref:YcaO-like family protein n=1 Tax=Nonomuraea sp. SYSU D8015 TaxID=2593644 RepID=UPI00166156FF|nr:YcaO-like family protein [Nonomuraea sp. SYSU D8015]